MAPASPRVVLYHFIPVCTNLYHRMRIIRTQSVLSNALSILMVVHWNSPKPRKGERRIATGHTGQETICGMRDFSVESAA